MGVVASFRRFRARSLDSLHFCPWLSTASHEIPHGAKKNLTPLENAWQGEGVDASVYGQESMRQSSMMSVLRAATMTHTGHATINGGSVHGGKSLPNT